MKKCQLISIEGVEGVGKTTAIAAIRSFFQAHQIDCVFTREPGGTEISENIRQVLLQDHDSDEKLQAQTELLLMFAARSQNINHVIRPALQKGLCVVSDRFTDASFAYQGGGRGLSMDFIAQLEAGVNEGLVPNLTLLLDAPIEVALARIRSRESDRIEKEPVAFFERVRSVYLERAKQFPDRFVVIDATGSITQVSDHITSVLTSRFVEVA